MFWAAAGAAAKPGSGSGWQEQRHQCDPLSGLECSWREAAGMSRAASAGMGLRPRTWQQPAQRQATVAAGCSCLLLHWCCCCYTFAGEFLLLRSCANSFLADSPAPFLLCFALFWCRGRQHADAAPFYYLYACSGGQPAPGGAREVREADRHPHKGKMKQTVGEIRALESLVDEHVGTQASFQPLESDGLARANQVLR